MSIFYAKKINVGVPTPTFIIEPKKIDLQKQVYFLVEEGGFEPPKASPTDLQSVPFGRSGTLPYLY